MEKIISIDLATQTSPKVVEVQNKDYIEYGTENWANLYPQFLIDLYYNSSTHAAIINATRDMIAGEGLLCEETDDIETHAKLKQFMSNVNGKESLHDVIKKLAFDFKLQGGFAMNLIWNKARTEIAEIHHIPVERIRCGKPNEFGIVDTYYISADWSDIRKNKPTPVPAFNMNDRTSPSQILYDGDYSPNMELYYSPDYGAACNWALIDQHVSEFHLSNIANGFSGSYFVNFANGVPTAKERAEIERSLVDKFAGSTNSGKIVLTFSDDQSKVPVINPIAVSNADKQYLALQELLVQNILTGHRVTSPMLMGIKNNTGLGSNVDELNTAFEVYLNTVIKPYQNKLLNCISKILKINKIDLPIEIIQNKPITSKFSVEDMKSVMTQDEIREELGLPPLEAGENVEEDDFAKVGSMVTDGVELPLFDTIEEAEAEAERLGCTGYHEHSQDGKTYYMPCENHEQITSLNEECNCKEELISPNPCQKGWEPYGHKIKDGRKVPNCVPIKASELEKFILAYGEENPDDNWHLLSDEKVEDEREDFDYELELNKLHKYEFDINTGDANPDEETDDKGIDRNKNLYIVRYRYSTAIASQNTREFCKKMLSANKLYRKEDIIAMENKIVNYKGKGAGMGPEGAKTYSIWKFKGGVNCGHYWRREIYFYKLGVGTGTDVEDATRIITTTEARANGFYPEANPQEVSRAPKNMPNNGRLK